MPLALILLYATLICAAAALSLGYGGAFLLLIKIRR